MARAAVVECSRAPFQFDKSSAEMPKRKTPSELREEQLKRRATQLASDSLTTTSTSTDRLIINHGIKRPEPLKKPKYIDTRVNDVFPVIKSCRSRFGPDKSKEPVTDNKTNGISSIFLHNQETSCTVSGSKKFSSYVDQASRSDGSAPPCNTIASQTLLKGEKCTEINFRSVTELSLRKDASAGVANITMDKAFKGLVAREMIPGLPTRLSEISDINNSISSKINCNEFPLPGNKIPLDFTLKTTLRMVSSASIKWLHRIVSRGSYKTQNGNTCSGVSSDQTICKEVLFSKALQSWRYPQSCLPSSIALAMSLSTTAAEVDFLKKRQQDWEDSFTNLYYMFRQNTCGIFYVYTSHFVVLFVRCLSAKKKNSCTAYISRSTLGLRALLSEHDVRFSMPLCQSEVEHTATTDDLAELSAIGQVLRLDSESDVDNSPQSLLSFIGNENVHALYDFLLNYRFFLSSLSSFDVPLLYAPVAFQNSSISFPEVRCKEMKKADRSYATNGYLENAAEPTRGMSQVSFCYSVDMKDDIIPPWVVSGMCAAMASTGVNFEMSFTDEAKSSGLNVVLNSLIRPDLQEDLSDSVVAVIADALPKLWLKNASLRNLKYSDGSYNASITCL